MITNPKIVPVDAFGAYSLSWTGSDPLMLYHIYRDGVEILTTRLTSARVTIEPGTRPVFDIVEDGQTPAAVFPGVAVLTWTAAAESAKSYLIEQYISAAWVEVGRMAAGAQQTYFQWQSDWLADVTTHQFRVSPINAAGVTGTATTFAVFMVRYPDPPQVSMTYAAGTGKVTIAQA